MREAYPIFIFVSVVGLVIGAVFVYVLTKQRNLYTILSTTLWFSIPSLMITGMILESQKLVLSALFFPILLFCIVTFSELIIHYHKCTHPIPATYVSFTERSHRGIHHYFPTFSFCYNGQTLEVTSFIRYSKRKLNKLFEENNTYEVFINPQDPHQCTDKRRYPVNIVVGIVFCVLFLAFTAIVVILI